GYFAPQYMASSGDIMPISAYMVRSCMVDTVYPTQDSVLRAFRACLEQRPELKDESEFLGIAKAYLDSTAADPSHGDPGMRRKWFTCMEIVAAMTCIYNNAVPYLMDMERIGKRPGGATRPTLNGDAGKKGYVEVERMVDPEKDYGHDCEDSSMNADMRKRGLDMFMTRMDVPEILRVLGRISNLFVSYVCQMFCGGDDGQTTGDD